MSASSSPTILPADIPIEEETIPGFNSRNFYPVNPGDLLNNRYRIVAKVGWGTTSTVWLAQDTQQYVLSQLNEYCA
jgi:serine/threonine-protein kinase SRPK3